MPIAFHVREALGQSPAISPKLKIYAIDDSTFAKLGTWVLPLEDWVKIFQTIAANHPRAIVIDAMFSRADNLTGDLQKTVDALKSIQVPLIIGSWVTPQAIRYREPLKLTPNRYAIDSFLAGRPRDEVPPMSDKRGWHAYGAAAELQPAFAHIGNILYNANGVVTPLVQLDDDQVMMHMALYTAKDRHFERGHLILDGAVAPMDDNGDLTVNFPSPGKLAKAIKSMKGLIQMARAGEPSTLVENDDVVLIIPQMFTGNTDFAATPFGALPGGFVHASLLNSILTGQWLKPVSNGESLIAAAVVTGALLAARSGVALYWASLVCGLVGGLIASLWLFAFQSVIVPWLFPAIGFLGASLSVFAVKLRAGERKAQLIRQAFDGAVAPEDLKSILKRPEQLNFEARERVVTLMFVDVVGFSLLAENMLPRLAFDHLKNLLATVGDAIHEHGGIIDKTLGDGLLCYFGYRFDGDETSPDHAERALRCAVKIQEANLKRNIEAARTGEPVYPLRIGINTASCYLGDLGSQSRIDFTVVGNGVNFAKRLEGACESHGVLIGATTNDLVKGIGLNEAAFTKRFIRIKHHSELVEAYEYDAFFLTPALKAQALEGFRKCANIERVDQRWSVHDPAKFTLRGDFGVGELVSFSHGGLSVRLPALMAKGTAIQIVLDAGAGLLSDLLEKEGLKPLQGEVRWGYADGRRFVHGIMLTNISAEQAGRVVEYLSEFAFSQEVGRERGKSNDQAS